jgi:hypothetical protein
MVEWLDGSHSSVNAHDSPLGVCQKAPKGLSGHEKPRLKSLAWMPTIRSGGNLASSLRWSMVVAASGCGDVFQRQELGD